MRFSTVSASVFFASLASYCQGLSSVSAAAKKQPAVPSSPLDALRNFDYNTENRLPWIEKGYGTWKWRGHDINYVELGDSSKPALLLIHGFGASSYHFRHNIPDLARDYHVYAFDMLGFGLSSKPVQAYPSEVWRDQAIDFVTEVIGKPATIAGNSLGGFTALYTAASKKAKSLITGCVLLNAAGRFKSQNVDNNIEKKDTNVFMKKLMEIMQRMVIGASFFYTKQSSSIEQVLKQVYPVNSDMVDSELVESIQLPSRDPNAAEVFYQVVTRTSSNKMVFVDDLLQEVECPLLLCWGEEDPWISSDAADKIQAMYPQSKRVSIDAGHCPHDEDPKAVNKAIRAFMQEVTN